MLKEYITSTTNSYGGIIKLLLRNKLFKLLTLTERRSVVLNSLLVRCRFIARFEKNTK